MTLETFFIQHNRCALAFSGGTDSAYLLYAAKKYNCDIHAYYVNSAFQPRFELEDAQKLVHQLKVPLTVLEPDLLCEPVITANPADRCYHCKKIIFQNILSAAKADGYELLLDGTNASDQTADRPGMKVLTELSVRSPLRECNLCKDEVRRLSKEAGLFTWNKAAYACLATRIPTGEEITLAKLEATEHCEQLLSDLGFYDFRIRRMGACAKIQVREEQLSKLLEYRKEILDGLKSYYSAVTLDLEVRS